MKRITSFICWTIPLVLLFGGAALAAGAPPEGLTVVYTQWYPYTYQEDNAAKGFEIDIFKAVMETMNIKVKLLRFPFRRCLKMLRDGQADVLISLLPTPERRIYTIFPGEHISVSKTLLFTRADRKIRYKGSLEDLKGYRIGVIAGFSYGRAFDNAKDLKKEEVLDAERLISMVLGGRCDLGIENEAVIKGVAGKLGVERSIRFLYPPVHTRKLYVGFSKRAGLNRLAEDFSRTLKEFKDTGEYRAILRRYGISSSDMTQQKAPSPGN